MTTPNTSLEYTDSDGVRRKLDGLHMSIDKAGRYWLWSADLEHNLAYKENSRDACLLSAIESLLFTIKLRDERISKLQRIANLAQMLADEIKPDEDTN